MENSQRVNQNLVSIIIPCKVIDDYTRRCIIHCDNLDYPNKEIMVITDLVCPGYPATKRNWAMDRAKGDIYAFIDADACPAHDWLDNALVYLKKGYLGVCGPGILPSDAPLLEQATDLVLKWLPYSYRVTPKSSRIIPEFPTFNLIVWKTGLRFKTYLTGEDSLFCRELGKIFYHPSILVYHHRRPLFKPYWKQISTYGQHRGHLIRLAVVGWFSTLWVYGVNFIKGLTRRKI